MNSQANLSLLRQFLTVIGGLFAGYGIGNAAQWSHMVDDVAVAVPALISLGSIMWSFWAHYKQVKVPELTLVKPVMGGTMPAIVAVKEGLIPESKS